MTGVYATIANQGKQPKFRFLSRIETSDGKVLVQSEQEKHATKQILTEEESAIMTHFLESVVDSGTARRLRHEYRFTGAIAGKTGTTQNQSDGWFVGFTPGLLAGVWVGAEIPSVHFKTTRQGQGANTALPIWARFMKRIERNKRTRKYMQGSFASLNDSAELELDCPHFLPRPSGVF